MKCTKCGSEVNSGDHFCVHCGEKIPENSHVKRQRDGNLKFLLLQVLICIILAAFMLLFIFFGHSVIIQTVDSENLLIGDFSLLHVIGSLVYGTNRYPPSVLSIVMGVTVLLFVFSAPAFWIFSAATALLRKGENGIRRMSVILTFLAIGSVCALPQLAYLLISQFKLIYAKAAGVLLEDMRGITSPLSYVWAGLVVFLMAACWFFVFKRREGERKGQKNEK